MLIATKSQHTLEALESVLPLFGPDTFVVSYQNGFNEPDIAAMLNEAGLGGRSGSSARSPTTAARWSIPAISNSCTRAPSNSAR